MSASSKKTLVADRAEFLKALKDAGVSLQEREDNLISFMNLVDSTRGLSIAHFSVETWAYTSESPKMSTKEAIANALLWVKLDPIVFRQEPEPARTAEKERQKALRELGEISLLHRLGWGRSVVIRERVHDVDVLVEHVIRLSLDVDDEDYYYYITKDGMCVSGSVDSLLAAKKKVARFLYNVIDDIDGKRAKDGR